MTEWENGLSLYLAELFLNEGFVGYVAVSDKILERVKLEISNVVDDIDDRLFDISEWREISDAELGKRGIPLEGCKKS